MTTSDSVLLPRFVLVRAQAAGLDPAELARAAGLGSATVDQPQGSVPGHCYQRLWELFEHRVEQPHVGLRGGERFGTGELGMLEYLVTTADTVGAGLRAAAEFGDCMTSSRRLEVTAVTERHTIFTTRAQDESRGAEIAAQASFAFLLSRARHCAKAAITPAAVTFRQRSPRRHTAFTEFFGTAAIEFGAERNTLTMCHADLERRQHTADPRLAAVLRRGASASRLHLPPATAWADLVAGELDSLGSAAGSAQESVSLGDIARRLHVSPRTLQRRLAAAGTSFSRELDDARRRLER
ncbi:AraC family transcriptional regulator ligand-binding domain-containing protein [Nocardia sp. NBC_00511]|uniref:AraC family transcriptional regulator ligand-binding domain-containing protein n=1 Tax=Nocardia sp. NBC_00511 TaxID=2903591 RepID=UPI0030E334C7